MSLGKKEEVRLFIVRQLKKSVLDPEYLMCIFKIKLIQPKIIIILR